MGIIEAAEVANQRQKKHLVKRIADHFGKDLSKLTFALWGIAFKPNTDDIREAPALALIEELTARGARVRAYDPVAMPHARQAVKNAGVEFCKDAYDAAAGASAVLLVTEWNEFRQIDFAKVKSLLKSPVLFDGRNIYDPEALRKQGFKYFGIGR
jgi:UDPglucose 6-dehydrogenase